MTTTTHPLPHAPIPQRAKRETLGRKCSAGRCVCGRCGTHGVGTPHVPWKILAGRTTWTDRDDEAAA